MFKEVLSYIIGFKITFLKSRKYFSLRLYLFVKTFSMSCVATPVTLFSFFSHSSLITVYFLKHTDSDAGPSTALLRSTDPDPRPKMIGLLPMLHSLNSAN